MMGLMKKNVKVWAVLMAALTAVTACQKEKEAPVSDSLEFTVGECEIVDNGTVTGGAETRTYFTAPTGNSYPTLWTGGEAVKGLIETSASSAQRNWTAEASSDHKTAKLTSNISITTSYNGYDFYFVCPASAYKAREARHKYTFAVPSSQTPLAASPDEAAQVIVGKSAHYTSFPSGIVNLSSSHLTAYVCLSLKSASAVGTLQSVTLTSTQPLSGNVTYSFNTKPSVTVSDGTSNSVTVNTSKLSNIWFATLPAQVAGTKLTITAKGSSGTLTREITVPSGKNLESGKVAILSVTMDQTVHVTGVSLNRTSLTLEKGATSTLTATVTPSNATNKSVTWSSSNTSVATVTSAGVVKGVAVGSATITATTVDGGKKATCAVTVTAAKATKVEILNANEGVDPLYDVDALHITPSQPATIQYKVTYSDGTTTTNSGATLSVYTGSGVSVSGRTVTCTSVTQTATIKVTATSNSNAFSVIDVNTWSDPTSITWQNPFIQVSDGMYAITGQDYYMNNVFVYPSTARQKVVLEKADNTGGATLWTISRLSDKRFKMTLYTTGREASYYPSFSTNFKISAWHKSSVCENFTVKLTNFDVSKPKMFDYVAYNSTTQDYRVIDGGCRVLMWKNGTWNSGVSDFYCLNQTLSVPSGYKVVGIVVLYYGDDTYPADLTQGLAYPSQLVTYGPDGKKLTSGKIHGYAISMYNAVADKWCAENDNVDTNENWSRELCPDNPSHLSTSTQSNCYNGFNLTVAAHQYNVWRGSSHALRPADRCWDYGEPGKELICHAFPVSNPSLTFVMRPWFVPTIFMWWPLAVNGSYYGTTVMNKINAQITKAGFGDQVFPYSTDSYWTINTNQKNYAYIVYKDGHAERAKSSSAGVRPFMIF